MWICGGICIVLVLGVCFLRKKQVWKRIRSPCLVLLLFCIFGLLTELSQSGGNLSMQSRELERNAPGEGTLETEAIFCLPEEDTEYPMSLQIPERVYRTAEEEELLQAAVEEIDETFCGTNSSLQRIVEDPVVHTSYQNGAVEAEWIFSEDAYISAEGRICQQELRKERQEVDAYVALTCGKSEVIHRFSFVIWAKKRSKAEQARWEVQKQIELQEETDATVVLPEEVNGQKVRWKRGKTTQSAEILGLGVLAAIAIAYVEKEQKEKQVQRRKQELLLAYPEFVSKLSLLLGAGMTISGALRKMNQMYLKRKASGGREEAAYEELYRMICEMDNGMGEIRAYQKFAEACDLQSYRKLISLLIFGQKVGNRKLMEQLNEEADRVFLERKNTARRLGEEAGTKMLFPMMLMLVIVMGIVIIPAFLSIYEV